MERFERGDGSGKLGPSDRHAVAQPGNPERLRGPDRCASVEPGGLYSYALRFSIFLEYAATYGIFEAGPLYVAAVMFSFYAGGVYRVYWLQTSIEELLILLKAYVLACAVLIGLYIGVEVPFVVPLSVMGMLVLCGFAFLTLLRLSWRVTLKGHNGRPPRKTLIVGAGEAGALLARDLKRMILTSTSSVFSRRSGQIEEDDRRHSRSRDAPRADRHCRSRADQRRSGGVAFRPGCQSPRASERTFVPANFRPHFALAAGTRGRHGHSEQIAQGSSRGLVVQGSRRA